MIVKNVRYGEIPICKIYQNGVLIWATYIDYLYAASQAYLSAYGHSGGVSELPDAPPAASYIETHMDSHSRVELPQNIRADAGADTLFFAKLLAEKIENFYLTAGLGGTLVGIANPKQQATESILMETDEHTVLGMSGGATTTPTAAVYMYIDEFESCGTGDIQSPEDVKLVANIVLRAIAAAWTNGNAWGRGNVSIDTGSDYAHGNTTDIAYSRGLADSESTQFASPKVAGFAAIKGDAGSSWHSVINRSLFATTTAGVGLATATQIANANFDTEYIETTLAHHISKIMSAAGSFTVEPEIVYEHGAASIELQSFADITEPLRILTSASSSGTCTATGSVIRAWLDPIQTDTSLYIRQAYETLPTDSTLTIG